MRLFEGAYTALVTPFLNGKVDFYSLKNLVEAQLKSGIQGFVVNGTTAESPNLSEEEAFAIFDTIKEVVDGRVPLIFGSGSNSTQKTIDLSQKAWERGADGLLVVVPYYNKPPQRGLMKHFEDVAKSVDAPIMLYNVPGRTITSLTLESIVELSKIKNIRAIKEASGDIKFAEDIIKSVDEDFVVSSGDDETCVNFRKVGGRGIVSVASHVLPELFVKCFSNEYSAEMEVEFDKYKDLISSLYISSNPIPVKKALSHFGLISSPSVRLPLIELLPDQIEELYGHLNDKIGSSL